MNMDDLSPAQLTPVLVHLMKGVLYRDTHGALWQNLALLEARVRDYVAVLGLELWLDEAEGYAFLKQRPGDDADGAETPKLVARRPLSYPVSLLCVLLRKRLAEADHGGGDVKTVLTRDDLHNAMRVYLKPLANEARQAEQMDTAINKTVELGFLKPLAEAQHFEVRRIVKALVDADWLVDVNEKLEVYRRHAE